MARLGDIFSILYQEKTGDIFPGQEGIKYPLWWGQAPFQGSGSGRPEEIHGFPELSWWYAEAVSNGEDPGSKMPPFKAENIEAPGDDLYPLLWQAEEIATLWQKASSTNDQFTWIDYAMKAATFYHNNISTIQKYNYINFKEYLNFYGVNYNQYPDISHKGATWFQETLGPYLPGKWILMVELIPIIMMQRIFKKYKGFVPFKSYKIFDVPKGVTSKYPHGAAISIESDLDGKHSHIIPVFSPTHRETTMRGLMPWFTNDIEDWRALFHFRDDVIAGKLEDGDFARKYISSYQGEMMKYAQRLMFYIDANGNRVWHPDDPLHVMSITGYPNVATINDFFVQFCQEVWIKFQSMESKADRLDGIDWKEVELPLPPTFGLTPILPMHRDLKFFMGYKQSWCDTARWTFMPFIFKNRPPWPITMDPLPTRATEQERELYDFIQKHPPKRLKVPPFNFSEWERRDSGWVKVFELQWNSYIDWCLANIAASKSIHMVEFKKQAPIYAKLTTPKGEPIPYVQQNNGKTVDLINSYPDFGIIDQSTEGESIFSGIVQLFVWPTVAFDWIWGDTFWGALYWIGAMFREVLDFIWEFAKKLAPEILKWILIAAAIIGGVYLTVDLVENEFDKK